MPTLIEPAMKPVLDLSTPRVLAILNVTPDSFSDGGLHATKEAAVARALAIVDEGAWALDVGGESTRPGAAPVPEDEERRRVLPVVEALAASKYPLPISVDTRRASVARDALAAGASIVNDVTALSDPEMGSVVARAGASIIIMHSRGTPETMQSLATYRDVVQEVAAFLRERAEAAKRAGVDPERILIDPGLGFAKTAAHNWALLSRVEVFASIAPVVIGASRKSFLGALLGGAAPEKRVAAGVGVAVAAALAGARVIRTHDVRPTVEALSAMMMMMRSAPRETVKGGDGCFESS